MRKDKKYRHPWGERVDGYLVTEHPLYSTWAGMWERCTEPTSVSWNRYGGRGITVCDRWLRFENFAIDMGLKPYPEASLNRIDNDDGYNPDNCEWANGSDQCVNRGVFKNNTSGTTGVVRKGASWIARFDYEKVRYTIGWFETKDEAIEARERFVSLFFTDKDAALAMLPKDKARFTSKTGVRGVTQHVDGGFTVRVTYAGSRHYLGYFQSFDEACAAREKFLLERDAGLTPTPRDTEKARANSQTGVKGVCPHNDGYVAHVTVGGEKVYVGKFKTIEEASNARQDFLAEQVA